ncbi:outer membrane protein assembly factor BamD [bacterium]|nr:outer membrane protein assembly factor BamD [bacterium]
MKSRTGSIAILLLTAGLAAGCASRKEIVRFQEDTAAIQDRLTGLQKDNEQMREQLREINRSILSLRESNASVKADLLSEISSLREETVFLRNLLDDTGSRMSRMMRNFDRPAGAGDAAGGGSGPPPSPESARALYDAAYLDLSRKNYDLAAGEFREYLRLYPASEYSGNAQYWIAGIFYVKKDYAAALAAGRLGEIR